MFDAKTLLITGAIGLFGIAVSRRFLSSGLREIQTLSQDDQKQDEWPTSMTMRRSDSACETYATNAALARR